MNTPQAIVPHGQAEALAKLRKPFEPHHISKLPKPTKAQTDQVKADFKRGVRCKICGSWHHPDVVHLDYVGHAALTDRLLDTDPEWNWEPMGLNPDGTPALDRNGGLWIRLTVCGVTRPGYGCADGKSGGDAMKEIIGDALRNAAMRFGAALDLWHKGDLHVEESADEGHSQNGAVDPPADYTPLEPHVEPTVVTGDYAFPEGPAKNITALKGLARSLWREIEGCGDDDELSCLLGTDENKAILRQLGALEHPGHRQIWEGDGKDNPGISGLITRKQNEFAQPNILAAG